MPARKSNGDDNCVDNHKDYDEIITPNGADIMIFAASSIAKLPVHRFEEHDSGQNKHSEQI